MKMYILFVLFLLGVLTFLYSLIYEPYALEVKKYTLKNPKLSGLKIVFASDFHMAPYSFEQKRLQRIIKQINSEKADIVILGGDFVKGHRKKSSMPIENIAAELRGIKSRYGIYAVLGNHDTYYGKAEIVKVLTKIGITVLQNQNIKVKMQNRDVYIVGVKDYASDMPDIQKALNGCAEPVILLSHSPDVFPDVNKVDLMLAGHTHGGQVVFPVVGALCVPSKYGQKYRYGLITEQDKTLIISKGLGTSFMPFRFNCKPEIVVINFE